MPCCVKRSLCSHEGFVNMDIIKAGVCWNKNRLSWFIQQACLPSCKVLWGVWKTCEIRSHMGLIMFRRDLPTLPQKSREPMYIEKEMQPVTVVRIIRSHEHFRILRSLLVPSPLWDQLGHTTAQIPMYISIIVTWITRTLMLLGLRLKVGGQPL